MYLWACAASFGGCSFLIINNMLVVFYFFYFSGNFYIPIFSNSLHLDPLVWFEKWSLVAKLVPVTHRGSLCLYTYLLTNWKNASLCVKVGRSSVELHCCCSPGCRVEMFLWHFTGRYEKQSLTTFRTGLAFSPQYCPAESRKICIPQNYFHLKLHLCLQKCLFNTTNIVLTMLIKEVQVL